MHQYLLSMKLILGKEKRVLDENDGLSRGDGSIVHPELMRIDDGSQLIRHEKSSN